MNKIQKWTRTQLVGSEAERAFEGRIQTNEIAVEAPDAQHVQGQHEEAIEYLFGARAVDELPDLAAHGRKHIEEFGIGLADIIAEKLDDAQNLVSEQNGKSERG